MAVKVGDVGGLEEAAAEVVLDGADQVDDALVGEVALGGAVQLPVAVQVVEFGCPYAGFDFHVVLDLVED